MTTTHGPTDADPGREESEERSLSQDPALRALLDHVAEELAAEFVKLMRASVAIEADAKPKEKKR